jgi:transposase InsO family protein
VALAALREEGTVYTARWQAMLKGAGVKVLKLPPRSPDLNAYAERFVLSIRSECLDRIVPLGEWHLRRTIREYVEHYHQERNHQGLENQLIEPVAEPANNNVAVSRDIPKVHVRNCDRAGIAGESNEGG